VDQDDDKEDPCRRNKILRKQTRAGNVVLQLLIFSWFFTVSELEGSATRGNFQIVQMEIMAAVSLRQRKFRVNFFLKDTLKSVCF
jgi:hypothetical protein